MRGRPLAVVMRIVRLDVALAEVELPAVDARVEHARPAARATTRRAAGLKKSTDAPLPFHHVYSVPSFDEEAAVPPLFVVRATAPRRCRRRARGRTTIELTKLRNPQDDAHVLGVQVRDHAWRNRGSASGSGRRCCSCVSHGLSRTTAPTGMSRSMEALDERVGVGAASEMSLEIHGSNAQRGVWSGGASIMSGAPESTGHAGPASSGGPASGGPASGVAVGSSEHAWSAGIRRASEARAARRSERAEEGTMGA